MIILLLLNYYVYLKVSWFLLLVLVDDIWCMYCVFCYKKLVEASNHYFKTCTDSNISFWHNFHI